MTKYGIDIDAGSGYSPKVGWDALHDTRSEAEAMAERARASSGWRARVFSIDAPPHVDHLYRAVQDPTDTTYLYG